MADLDSCVMDLMYWSSLPGIPKKVKWPVRVYDWGNGNTGTVTVYCRSDDAYFTVQQSQLVAFPNSLKSWKEKGISALKKRKQTLTEFLTDIEWADVEMKMSSQDGHRENTKTSNGDGNHEQVEMKMSSQDGHRENTKTSNGDGNHEQEEIKMSSQDGHRENTKTSNGDGNHEQVEMKMSSQDGHRENTKTSNGDGNHEQVEMKMSSQDGHRENTKTSNGDGNHEQVEMKMSSQDGHRENTKTSNGDGNHEQEEIKMSSQDGHRENTKTSNGDGNHEQVEMKMSSQDGHRENTKTSNGDGNHEQEEIKMSSQDGHRENTKTSNGDGNHEQEEIKMSSQDGHPENTKTSNGDGNHEQDLNDFCNDHVSPSGESDSDVIPDITSSIKRRMIDVSKNEEREEETKERGNKMMQKVTKGTDSDDSEDEDSKERWKEKIQRQKGKDKLEKKFERLRKMIDADDSKDESSEDEDSKERWKEKIQSQKGKDKLKKKIKRLRRIIDADDSIDESSEDGQKHMKRQQMNLYEESMHNESEEINEGNIKKRKMKMNDTSNSESEEEMKDKWKKMVKEPRKVTDNDDIKENSKERQKTKMKRQKEEDKLMEKVKKLKRIIDADDSTDESSKERQENIKRQRQILCDEESMHEEDRDDSGDEETINDTGLKHQENIIKLRDKNIKGLYIKKIGMKTPKGNSKNTRLYDNKHACFFCGKVVLHIKEHLQSQEHRRNELVKNVLASEKPDFTLLRKMGDDKHNRTNIEKGEGEIILARRPKSDVFDVSQFGPCVICKEWVCLKGIKYHYNQCKKQQDCTVYLKKRELIIQSRILAGHVNNTASPLMKKEVLPIMTNDTVSHVAQGDPLIMALGDSWVRRNMSNIEKRKYYASSRMRLVARLLIQLNMLKKADENRPANDDNPTQNIEGESSTSSLKITTTMWDFLKTACFDHVVIGSLRCSFPNADDLDDLAAPSNAIKLKYDIARMVNSKWAFIVKKTADPTNKEALDCEAFLKLMNVEWKEKVTVFARAVLNRRKYELVKELPSPEDIRTLTEHLVKTLRTTDIKTENFKQLVVLAQTRLLLFNKRRTGELEVIKLQSYASRSIGLNDFDESLAGDLTAVEKKLLETQDLLKIRGKIGKPVPVIVPTDVRATLSFLADKKERTAAGICHSNPYLFPNSANSYARAYESLKSVCSDLNLQAPHQITSVSMRKYTATLTQMLNLGKNQMEWVYQHLGHTKAVHKEHYRQMSGLLERTKISKMFLIQDLNLTGKFKDKTLEEIDIRDIVFGADEPVVEDDVPIDGNLSENLSVPENPIDPDEEGISAEAAILDEEEDKEEEEEDDTEMQTETRNKKKSNRKKWVEGEIKELNKYFKEFFQTGTTPRRAFIDEIKKKSRKNGGLLHLRESHLIVKKISNMNHSNKRC